MTCLFCKFEFCWHCRGFSGPGADHFNPLNPNSCGVGQMESGPPSSWITRKLKFLSSLLIILLLLPFFLVFLIPCACFVFPCKYFDQFLQNCGVCFGILLISSTSLLLFTVGFIADVVFIPLAILTGVYLIIAYFVDQWRKRR